MKAVNRVSRVQQPVFKKKKKKRIFTDFPSFRKIRLMEQDSVVFEGVPPTVS